MINKVFSIKFNDFIVDRKNGEYVLNSGIRIRKKQLTSSKLNVECHICGKSFELSFAARYFFYKYICKKCSCSGERGSFFGKKHTQETKDKIGKANKSYIHKKGTPSNYTRWIEKYGIEEADKRNAAYLKKLSDKLSGSGNPMYGKKMLPEWIEKSNIGREKWFANRTEEYKAAYAKKISDSQKKLQKEDPKKYKALKAKGGIAASKSVKKYKINKIENLVSEELEKLGLFDFEYTVILDSKQFDFGNKEFRVLLEVQGDYWHANPKIYSELNQTQKNIREKDIVKMEFAKNNGFMLFHIWEQDILNGDFSVLNLVKDHINEIRASRDKKD